jgi:hypothetical protein
MNIKDRYTIEENPRWGAILRDGVILLAALIFLVKMWPFYSVPTGSRGVVTQFGKIVGIEQEGLAVLPPWRNLTLFSIRAEEADIDNASGSTSDTQPVSVSLKIATAQAEALRVQNSALAQSKEVLELRRIEVEQTKADRWNGQLPQNVYAGAPIPFLNVSKQ